jgi:alpha-galactosidase
VAVLFPQTGSGTRIELDVDGDLGRLPMLRWLGCGDRVGPVHDGRPGVPLLAEHARRFYGRPGLRGHRLHGARTGRAWSTAFAPTSIQASAELLVIDAVDDGAGLGLRTEVAALPGGTLRARHVLTNRGSGRYLLDGLEVTVPIEDSMVELLDFTGRHMGERSPQRRPITDGLWVRESRGGRPGLDAATLLIAGSAGFSFGVGSVAAVSVAWSGNSVLTAQRTADGPAMLGGGELLLPGEISLGEGESYASPWVFVIAADDGLDGLAARLHSWQRSLPAHPAVAPVTLNVWEAVYFDHDLSRLATLAARAARVGVERFVLDDGWFRGRRDDTAGLGDWFVDEAVWPGGLDPLIDVVRNGGMQFGIWVEPEMVNPDSDLYRAHPDWALGAGERVPLLQRHQLVLDLTIPAVWGYLFERLDDVLSAHRIDYVKWDHNRPLLEAGSRSRGGAPAVHDQNVAFLRLTDALRAQHPHVAFESCASGGGRIDLGVLEHVQRVWTSDQTDALARQAIQRWTVQLVAPEYLGAHVSSPTSHHTGRTLPLDFRAATSFFGAFGIEWDLTAADDTELDRLAAWTRLHKQWRPLLHTGRVLRLDVADPSVLAHGVLAADRRTALLAHVQLDESAHQRGVQVRVPGLDPTLDYTCSWVTPDESTPSGPAAAPLRGAELSRVGLWLPRARPETIRLIALEAATQ